MEPGLGYPRLRRVAAIRVRHNRSLSTTTRNKIHETVVTFMRGIGQKYCVNKRQHARDVDFIKLVLDASTGRDGDFF